MFEEPGPIAEERPADDSDETWDDNTTDEMLHGQDDSKPVDDGDDGEEQEKAHKKGHFIAPPSV